MANMNQKETKNKPEINQKLFFYLSFFGKNSLIFSRRKEILHSFIKANFYSFEMLKSSQVHSICVV